MRRITNYFSKVLLSRARVETSNWHLLFMWFTNSKDSWGLKNLSMFFPNLASYTLKYKYISKWLLENYRITPIVFICGWFRGYFYRYQTIIIIYLSNNRSHLSLSNKRLLYYTFLYYDLSGLTPFQYGALHVVCSVLLSKASRIKRCGE